MGEQNPQAIIDVLTMERDEARAEVERLRGEVLKWTALSKTHSQGRERAEARLREVEEAARPFLPGKWGHIKAWIVAGAPSGEQGIEAARQMTNQQSALYDALGAAAQPKEGSRG